MADRTTAQAGDPRTGANWVGGVAPGVGDRAIIQHAMSLPTSVSWTFGTDPAAGATSWDLDIKSGGSLAIGVDARVSVRGNVILRNGTAGSVAIDNDGGIFEFDGSVSGVTYELRPMDSNSTQRRVRGRNWAIFRSHPDGPPAYFSSVSSRGLNVDFQGAAGQPVRVHRIGGPGLISQIGGNNDVAAITMRDVEFYLCGKFAWIGGQVQEATFERVTVLTPNIGVGERPLDIGSTTTGGSGLRHRLIDCSFGPDCPVYFGGLAEVEATGCTFLGSVGKSGGAGLARAWDDNTVGTGLHCPQMCATETGGYFLAEPTSDNAHSYNYAGGANGQLLDAVFEWLNDTAAGDPLTDGEVTSALGSSNFNLLVRGVLVIPTHDGHAPICASFLSDDGTGKVTYDHCTCAVGAGAIFGFGHGGDDGTKTARGVLTNTIAANFQDAPASGGKTKWVSNDVPDAMLPADAHHNVGYRNWASRYPATTATGYGHKLTDPSVPLGADDIDGIDPWPHWPTDSAARRAVLPRLRTWAAALGLSGTGKAMEAAALAAIHLRHLPDEAGHISGVTSTSLRDWVRAGWAPSNELLAGSASDATDRGAIPYADPTPPPTLALPDAEVGDTGPFHHYGPDPASQVPLHTTPRLGINKFFQDGNSPLKLLCTPTIDQPAHAHSDAMLAYFALSGHKVNTYTMAAVSGEGMPLSVVDSADTPGRELVFEGPEANEVSYDTSDPGPYPYPDTFRAQGVVGPAPPVESVGGDQRGIVVDRRTGWVYETYRVYLKEDGRLAASGGIVYDLRTGDWAPHITDPEHPNYVAPGTMRFPALNVNAAGVPVLPLCVRYEELYEYGEINHKVGMTFVNPKITGMWTWPAIGAAYSNLGQHVNHEYGAAFPYGATLRIKPAWYRANVHDFEVQTIDGEPRAVHIGSPIGTWGPGARVLLRALLEYGAINTDGGNNGDPWFIADARVYHDGHFNGDLIQLWQGLRLADLEVVDFERDILTYTVEPEVAPIGTPRTITVTCHLWDRHPEAHPTNPSYSINGHRPHEYRVMLMDAGTRQPLAGCHGAPGEPVIPETDQRVRITPDRPYARFSYTPQRDTPRFYPYTDPNGTPYEYLDEAWGVWTSEADIPTTVRIVPPDGSDYDPETHTLRVAPGEVVELGLEMEGASSDHETGTAYVIHTTPSGGVSIGIFGGTMTAGTTPGTYTVKALPWADQRASDTLTVIVAEGGGGGPDPDPDPPPAGASGLSPIARKILLLRGC